MSDLGEDGRQEVAVRRVAAEGSELAVFEFQGELRDLMISSFRTGMLTTGSYVPDAKTVSSQGAASITVAGAAAGSWAFSAAVAPTLFVATANPATLMNIGAGVGSAVIGAGGIVEQAPFIPIASSLPVVAPLLAFQVINTVVMMQQFKEVDQKLDRIKSTLDRAIARAEATHVGELLASSTVLDEVYRQYELSGSFSNDMIARLALAERDVKSLSFRFRQLVEAQKPADLEDPYAMQQANYDAHSAMLASFLDLRISYLRVCVDMQENPKSVESSLNRLKVKIASDIEFWQQLLSRSKTLKDAISALEDSLQDMNVAERHFPKLLGGKAGSAEKGLERLQVAYTLTMESELEIMEGFHALIQSAKDTRDALNSPHKTHELSPALVYWKDEEGEHSFVTEQLAIV